MLKQTLTVLLCECTKLKRQWLIPLLFACPLAVISLQFLVTFERGLDVFAEHGWFGYISANSTLWLGLMLPMLIALVTTIIHQIEHKDNGWLLMSSFAISPIKLFIAKFTITSLLIVLANLLMVCFIFISAWLLMQLGFPKFESANISFLQFFINASITSLPIILIGLIISKLINNFAAPICAAFIMVVFAMNLSRSESHWFYSPWTYPMISIQVADQTATNLAIALSLGLSAVLLVTVCTLFWWRHKQVA